MRLIARKVYSIANNASTIPCILLLVHIVLLHKFLKFRKINFLPRLLIAYCIVFFFWFKDYSEQYFLGCLYFATTRIKIIINGSKDIKHVWLPQRTSLFNLNIGLNIYLFDNIFYTSLLFFIHLSSSQSKSFDYTIFVNFEIKIF